MLRRSAEDHCGGGAAADEEHRRWRNLQTGRGSRLRHHFSSMIPKHNNVLSLALLRSILVIYIAIKCSDINPVADAAPSVIHCTTRAAFCTHHTRQATLSPRSRELGNIRPHTTFQVELGRNNFRASCKRIDKDCFSLISSPSSSTSALRLTGKQSEETVQVNGDTTIENDGSQAHEKIEISELIEASESSLIETELASVSINILDMKSEASDAVARKRDRNFLAKVTVLFSVVVFTLLKMSPSGSWRYYLAGGICASTSHAITTPIDVVKVRYILVCCDNL